MKTTCSVLIDSVKDLYSNVQWKAAAKYVNVDDLEIRNHNSISKTTFDVSFTEAVNEIQKFSEIKESALNATLKLVFLSDASSQWHQIGINSEQHQS